MKYKNLLQILTIILFFGLIGCSHLHPYHVSVRQGNILEAKTVQRLEVGMSKDEVADLFGTPVLRNAFTDRYWTYVYTKQIRGGTIEKKHLVLYFSGNRLTKIERQNI